jgi:hypothetical protein
MISSWKILPSFLRLKSAGLCKEMFPGLYHIPEPDSNLSFKSQGKAELSGENPDAAETA